MDSKSSPKLNCVPFPYLPHEILAAIAAKKAASAKSAAKKTTDAAKKYTTPLFLLPNSRSVIDQVSGFLVEEV
ncbi:hypothetical protein Acr_24g0009570 [Actinidia rufa]|uniref:Uncharacterized protein n=1 Tax=Actinidia rufa TaxID=165716 RepID=A0A7J0GV90_9ERIC|nr:hypothetical protein Acr_24g0009570 [Actinidia rufa]